MPCLHQLPSNVLNFDFPTDDPYQNLMEFQIIECINVTYLGMIFDIRNSHIKRRYLNESNGYGFYSTCSIHHLAN